MSDTYTIVPASASGGSVTLSVVAVQFPHAFAGLVWEFGPDQERLGQARAISSDTPSLSIGSPSVIDRHYYFIEGRVLKSNDNPPVPYVIEVTESQGGTNLHTEVPSDRGTGEVGTDGDAPFTYTFQIVAVAP